MKRTLFINSLIEWKTDSENKKIERILWVDDDNILTFVINVREKQCLPQMRRLEDIFLAIDSATAELMNEDPFIKYVTDEMIDEKDKNIRDNAWKIISKIALEENEPDIFYRNVRRKLIISAAEEFKVSDRVIYKYLTKFWQRGKSKSALLPDYDNSGGKGKSKKLGKVKLGRPRKNAAVLGIGINVDEATKKTFRIAINKFYENQKENSLTDAYHMMLKEYYAEDYRIEGGLRKPIIVPIGEIPSQIQFNYWYEVEKNIINSLTKRKGSKKFELNHRAVLGRSDADLLGPGSTFQIDATIADVFLVSRHNRNWIIGRPVVYIVMDAFTRYVTGLYVGLEGPSWMGAMMALANTFSNKVNYCSENGIEIAEEEWQCHHLPQAILADRGEMEGKCPENIISSLGVRIANTPSYRADWKGIVEQYFRLLKIHVKPLVPGFIDVDYRERGSKDYRLDAKLDIYQFTQIIIKCILYHNNQHWMNEYETDEMMITDDVNPIPKVLWEWGIEKRSGRLKAYPEDIVKLNLMPAGNATVTGNGIKFKNMYYSCDKAIKDMWFEKARNKRSWKEKISYDPRNMDYIYLRSEDGRSFEKCHMLDKRRYAGKTLDEIEYLDAFDQLNKDKKAEEVIQAKVDLLTDIEGIVSVGKKMTDGQKDTNLSKASRVKGIRDNRSNEKMENRKNEAFELGEVNHEKEVNTAKVFHIKDTINENLSIPNKTDYLRKKQKERLGKKDE